MHCVVGVFCVKTAGVSFSRPLFRFDLVPDPPGVGHHFQQRFLISLSDIFVTLHEHGPPAKRAFTQWRPSLAGAADTAAEIDLGHRAPSPNLHNVFPGSWLA
jgi:hypothetical protein